MWRGGGALIGMVGAATVWGLSPILYHALAHVPPLELLCHRVVWGTLVVALYAAATGRLGRLAAVFRQPREIALLATTAGLIAGNWFGFLWGVQSGHATESGLGYYIMPLVSVALGVVILGERLAPVQWAAVGLAVLAVGVLTWGLGSLPWLALWLAVSFALYGLMRKRMATGPIVGFLAESVMLAPLALGWIIGVEAWGWIGPDGRAGGMFTADWGTALLLMLSGPLTGVPLILFAEAARAMPLSTVGLVIYINPTLQLAVAGLVLGEPFTRWHWLALGLIWIGLALFSRSSLAQDRARRSAATAASASGTVI